MNKPSLYDSPLLDGSGNPVIDAYERTPAKRNILVRFRKDAPRSKYLPHFGAKQLAKAARRFRSGPPTGVGGFAGEDLP